MEQSSHRRLASALHAIIIVGLISAALGALVIVASPPGLGLLNDGPDAPVIEETATINFDVDFDGRLEWLQTDEDVVDAATARSRAGIGAPVTAHFALYEPSKAKRLVWVVVHLLGPIAVAAGLWLVLGIVRSAQNGNPFTTENEQRLWRLATLVAVGGTVVGLAGDFARNFALQRSAAADMFEIEATFSFLPIILGMAIGVLAGVWRLGVTMSDDIAATI